jgi:hypothetical protein
MSTVAFPQTQTVSYRLDGMETSAACRLVDLLAQGYIFGVLLSSFTQIPRKFPKLNRPSFLFTGYFMGLHKAELSNM